MMLVSLILFSFVGYLHCLPNLPLVYKTGLEVKAYWKGRIIIYSGSESRSHEKYAIRLNRFVISNTTIYVRRDASYLVLLDYDENLGRSLEVTNGRKKCINVFNITNDKRLSANDVKNLDTPVVSTRNLMSSYEKTNYSYVGMAVVRNISCHHWQRNDGNETVDYYYREKEGEMILVRIVESNPQFLRHSIYDYFAFQNVQPSMEEIEPPRGTYCSSKDAQPLEAPTLPHQMTMSVEYRPTKLNERIHRWIVVGYKVYWDEVGKRMRTDHHVRIKKHWEPVKDVIDSWRGIHYEAFSPTNCRVSQYNPVAESVNPYFKNKKHWIHLKKAITHYREYMNEYEHQGEHMVRGTPTDIWVYKNDMLGQEGFNEMEWYFTKPNVTEVASLGRNMEHQIPVRIAGYYGNDTKEYFEMDIFDFRHDVDNDVFTRPIRKCLDLSSSSIYTMNIYIIDVNTTAIREVHDMSSFTNYTMEAIQNEVKIKDESRFLTEFIIGQNAVTLLLSIVDYPYQQTGIPAKMISKALQNILERRPVSFTYQVNGTEYESSMRLSPMPWNYRKPMNCNDKDENKVKILAVFVVIAFIAGLCIMYGALYYVLRRNGTSLTELLRTKKKFQNENVTGENGRQTTETQIS